MYSSFYRCVHRRYDFSVLLKNKRASEDEMWGKWSVLMILNLIRLNLHTKQLEMQLHRVPLWCLYDLVQIWAIMLMKIPSTKYENAS